MKVQRVYSEAELFREAPIARPHVIAGRRLHGGFDAAGRYVPPRSGGRRDAIAAWSNALAARGGAPFSADASLLAGPRMPNADQQRLLIREGLGKVFWDVLTVTGKIEARGRVLADVVFPDLQAIVAADISQMAIGHLARGLLKAHGIDEGGDPAQGIGGHDVMWFVARDLAYGADAYPDVEPPASIARPESGRRWMPTIPQAYEGMLSFLMNLLLIEFRAEIGFANAQAILRTPDLFPGRRTQAEEAAEIVERIRIDEEIHIISLRLYLGELRALELRTVDGGTVRGADLIDPFWAGLVRWATVEQPALAAAAEYERLKTLILGTARGARLLAEFDRLGDPREPAASAG
jgi:hypothetical protein